VKKEKRVRISWIGRWEEEESERESEMGAKKQTSRRKRRGGEKTLSGDFM